MLVLNRLELMQYLCEYFKGFIDDEEELTLVTVNYPIPFVPFSLQNEYEPCMRAVEVFDSIGCLWRQFAMIRPINGGTVLYCV